MMVFSKYFQYMLIFCNLQISLCKIVYNNVGYIISVHEGVQLFHDKERAIMANEGVSFIEGNTLFTSKHKIIMMSE